MVHPRICTALLTLAVLFSTSIDAAEPKTVEEALVWLKAKSAEMIRASRREMADGTAAFPPQVGGGYGAFWLRDYAYMLDGSAAAFSDKELTDAAMLFLKGRQADGACVDCILFDGTPIYKPGGGKMGENPVADGSPFTVAVAWHAYQRCRDRKFAQGVADPLVNAMQAVPRDPNGNGLVYLRPDGYDRCPYGFTDTVRKTGDELFTSLLFVEASRRLADLLDAADRPDDARQWRTEADRVAQSIRDVLWDADIGLFRAATIRCREPDIWGSAFAVYLGVASEEQSLAIARYLKDHYGQIVEHGQIRHLPGDTYWELACPKDEYQNGGFWATPTGWFVYALDLVDPALADQTVVDMVGDFQRRGIMEWVLGDKSGVAGYLASVALPIDGVQKMLDRRKTPAAADRAAP